jgi:long-subunit acyl-CoA synthetase (AMP-forming)
LPEPDRAGDAISNRDDNRREDQTVAEVRTLVHRIDEWAAKKPDAPAVHGRLPAGGWSTLTWRDYAKQIRTVAKAYVALGVKPGDAISIIGRNRPEWLTADLGAIAAGAVPAPIYITNTPEQVAWVVRHCKAKVVVAENEEQYRKLEAERKNLPLVEKVILMDDVAGRDAGWTILFSDLLKTGEKGDDAEVARRVEGAKKTDLALLCYTSGTTGDPKGVMLTHGNVDFMTGAITKRFPLSSERIISYLPLCHVAEHLFTICNQASIGNEVFCCEELTKLKDYLPEVKPTLFLAVPRVWEKFEAALRAKLGEATGIKAKLAKWALATELECFKKELDLNQPVNTFARRMARKLVISKIKDKLGLTDVKMAFTGAAPMSPRTAEFFASLALPIHDCYGMTETTALLATSLPGRPRPGTVGKPLEGCEVKIDTDGEILLKGANQTPGYIYDEKQTAELLDKDGWLHTGDVGEFDQDGNLRITDRKKELFKTSGGKYIAPQMLEAKLKAIRGVGQAVAIGDNRKYVAAAIALCPENGPKVAAELGVAFGGDLKALSENATMRKYFEDKVEKEVNSTLARYEQIKKLAFFPNELTPEGGELTPTLKLRRKVINQKHAALIESLYAGAEKEMAGAGA